MAKSKEMEIAIKIAGKVEKSLGAAIGRAKTELGTIAGAAASATKNIGLTAKSVASSVAKGAATAAKVSAIAATAAVAAVSGLGMSAVNVGKEFETAMSQVSATMLIDKSTKEGQEAYETLEAAARECGRSTAFSASEAAEGLNYLALAGYDAEKAAAALPTVLNLAGAGAMELADASNMVTDAMSALGIEATKDNLSSFADNLAMTASKSNTSVSELGEAILTVGGTAKYLAGGTTELSTCIGLLADNGIHASEGGTKLRNMITSLTAPTDKAAVALNQLGVSAFDSEGNMRDMQAIFQDLNAAMAGMSTDESSAILSKIFNKTDLKAVNALLGTSAERWDELSGAIADSAGACEEMYALQLDNLEGDIKILQSGLSDLGISVYKDLNGPLREMTQLATSMVGKLSDAYGEGGMEGMVAAVGDCLSEVLNVALGHAPALVNMGISLLENLVDGIMQNSGEIAGAAARVLAVFVSGLFRLVPKVVLAGIDIVTEFAQSVIRELPQLSGSGGQAITGFLSGIRQRLPAIASIALQLIQTLAGGIASHGAEVMTAVLPVLESLMAGFLSNAPEIIAVAGQLIGWFISGVGQMLPVVIKIAAEIIFALVQGIAAALPSLVDSALQAVVCFVSGIIQNLPTIIQAALLLVQSLVDAIGQAAPTLLTAAVMLIGSLVLGSVQMLPRLVQMGIQLLQNLAQGLLANLPLILQIGTQVIVSLVSSITQSLPYLIRGGFQLIISLVQGIIQNLPAIAQAAIAIILSLIGGLVTAIPQLIDAALSLPFVIMDAILSTNWLQVGLDLIIAIGKGIIDGALSIGDSVINTIKGWFGGGSSDTDASSQGASAAQSYAAGFESSVPAVSSAASSLSTAAFGSMDMTSASEAGAQAGAAFSTGLSDSLGSISGAGPDMTAFNDGMASAGTAGANALRTGLNTGLASTTLNTGSILDAAALNTDMANAGLEGSEAFASGINTGIEGLNVDTSGLNAILTSAGNDGAGAVSKGISENSKAVTDAATTLGNGVNAALDSGWDKADSSARAAMQRITSTVMNAAQSAADAVKSAFENMVITIPKPQIPVISVSKTSVSYGDGGKVEVPQFSVNLECTGRYL